MKLSNCREHYYSHSEKASDVQRQLAFAGIAIIWIFHIGEEFDQKIPNQLTISAVLLSSALAFDLFHYLSASIMWGIYGRYKELRVTNKDDDFMAPRWMNWPGNTFFMLKIIFVIIAYFFLLKYLMRLLIK